MRISSNTKRTELMKVVTRSKNEIYEIQYNFYKEKQISIVERLFPRKVKIYVSFKD